MIDEASLNALFQYGLTLCKNRQDALDLLQTSVEKYLIESKKSSTSIGNVDAFLRSIMRNRFIDQHRHAKRFEHSPYQEESIYDISPTALEDLVVDNSVVESVWRLLPAIDREILYHWAVLGYSTEETSKLLNIAKGTLLSRIHRLRKRFEPSNADLSPPSEELR